MRVLLVEDEPKIADFVQRGLTEEGYAVDVADDGEEGLEWPSIADFDVILLDVMLPVLDGLTVCRTMRERGVTTPIIMLTAKDAIDDRVRGLDSGADDYLVKPFAFAELSDSHRRVGRTSQTQHWSHKPCKLGSIEHGLRALGSSPAPPSC